MYMFLSEIWPRLEEGALICKSRDDLVRYQTQIANVRVLQHQDRRPIATLSGSRRASSFWLTTVPHAPKSSRRTSSKRPGGPIATCRRPRHLLSPKAQAHGNDGPALGFLGNKGAPRPKVRVTLVWGSSCQAVVFGFCCQFFVRSGKGRSSSRRLRSGSRSARKGSRDRNASGALAACRLSVACVSQHPLFKPGAGLDA